MTGDNMGQVRSVVIKNGRVLLPSEQIQTGDVLIENGRIQEVGPSLAAARRDPASTC